MNWNSVNMNKCLLKKEWMKRRITYFSSMYLLFSLYAPSLIFADYPPPMVCVDSEAQWRSRTALTVIGATVVVLGAGIGYAVSQSGGHCKHHHSCSYSSYYTSPYTSCSSSNNTYYIREYTRGSREYSSVIIASSDAYSEFFSNRHHRRHRHHYTDSIENLDLNGLEMPAPHLPIRSQEQIKRRALSKNKGSSSLQQLSGSFFIPYLPELGQGNLTAYVQLPDGKREVLGNISLSGHTGTSLTFGPFDQIGSYSFGMHSDHSITVPTQITLGSLEICINETTVQNYEFILPPYSSPSYEPTTYFYDLLEDSKH